MKGILKRIGVMLLVFTVVMQSLGVQVYAAEDTEKNRSVQEEQSIVEWIEANIPEDYSELLNRPQEWWDNLTSNQKMAAEIFAEPIVEDNRFYNDQTLEEIIAIIENQEVKSSDFFNRTLFENITLEQLYELKNRSLELDDLADAILGLYDYDGYLMTDDKALLELAVTVSGYSPIMTFAYIAQEGEDVSYMTLKDTGYEDGHGHTFWRITNGGENVYCLKHGATLKKSYAYGNVQESTGAAEYLIKNYGNSSSDEGYMCIQMAVWALLDGQSESSVQTYAYSWFTKGGISTADAFAWAQTTKQFFSLAANKSGTIYVAEGPAGSQPIGKPTLFLTTPYTGGGTGGDTEEPEQIEPEFAIIEDSIKVNYKIKVRKVDWQTNVGLAGCKADVYENGTKVGTITTNANGEAIHETEKSASFSAEYCSNYEELTAEQKATVTCFTSLAEAKEEIEAKKSDFENIDYTFTCKEVTAPNGYVWQANEKSAGVSGNGSATFHFTNERTLGVVELVKYDTESESDKTQGEATLEGAVYGIYAAENILHQDRKTGIIYKKDQLVATGTIGTSPKRNSSGYILNTDGSRHIEKPNGTIAYMDTPGKTLFGDLELGKYYIKEITPAEGYMVDETVYDVTFTYKNQHTKIETRNETAADADNTLTVDDNNSSQTVYSGDYVIKQGIQFVKTSDNVYQTELKPIAGTGFSVYLICDLSGVKDGTLSPVNGIWGADDVMSFYDYDFTGESKAVLYKRGNETWTLGDTKWLTSLGGNKYEIAEMFTDAEGRIETPELPFGTYVIVETTTPENHVCAKPFIVSVTQDGGVLYTDHTKQTVEKTYTSKDALRYGDRKAAKGREGRILQKQRIINNTITNSYLRIVKADEEFLIQPGDYIKPGEVVRGTVLKEGAQYRLRCMTVDISEESLKALNWKYDEAGYLSYYDVYVKELLGTAENPFTTSFLKANGKILDSYITLPQKLPIGSYELTELTAPKGYVVNGSEQILYDTSVGRVNGYEIVEIPKEKVVFTIGNGAVYPDGQMGSNKYALQDGYGNLTVTVLQKNQAQKGIVGIYKHGEQLAAIEKDSVFQYEDAPIEGAQFQIVALEDIYTQELDAEILEQYDVWKESYLLHKEGAVVATVTTDRNGWGYAAGLPIGKYKIVETVAGDGFVLNTAETEFEITSQEQTVNFDIHSVDYKNERQKLEIEVGKTNAETKEPLAGAIYGLFTAEEIYTNIEYDKTASQWRIRDIPERLLEQDTLVATCTTNLLGKAIFDKDLPLGKYYIRELEAPVGFIIDTDDRYIDASYQSIKGGQMEEKQTYHVTVENYPIKDEDQPEVPVDPPIPKPPKKPAEKKEPEPVEEISDDTIPQQYEAASDTVDTGDANDIFRWCLIGILTGAMLVVILKHKKGKKSQ